MYQHGHGVDVDYKKAIEWSEKAAKQETQMLSKSGFHVPAWPRRGCELQEGDRVVREAAEQGHATAQLIWVHVHEGQGVDVNYKKDPVVQEGGGAGTQELSIIWVSCTSMAMAWM